MTVNMFKKEKYYYELFHAQRELAVTYASRRRQIIQRIITPPKKACLPLVIIAFLLQLFTFGNNITMGISSLLIAYAAARRSLIYAGGIAISGIIAMFVLAFDVSTFSETPLFYIIAAAILISFAILHIMRSKLRYDRLRRDCTVLVYGKIVDYYYTQTNSESGPITVYYHSVVEYSAMGKTWYAKYATSKHEAKIACAIGEDVAILYNPNYPCEMIPANRDNY